MFISPFLTWFLVAVFVFNMQFLWKYIDDIVGKGLELSIIFELLFYQALAMIPRALVFGVALASVMTMGNLAEHYELTSMKSAGVSLLRIMLPLMLLVGSIGVGSFMINNYAIPVAALKFKSRLHDIRKQKPALTLEEGFNDDFKNYSIFIGRKESQGKMLHQVRIYDHTRMLGNVSQVNAERGELAFTKDGRYLVINLYEGERQEERAQNPQRPSQYPYFRIAFKQYTSLFDMSQFETTRTDEDAFTNNASLMTISQLGGAMDSLYLRGRRKIADMQRNCNPFYLGARKHGIQPPTPDTLESITLDSISKPTQALAPKPTPEFTDMRPTSYLLDNVVIDPTKSSSEPFGKSLDAKTRILAYQRGIGYARSILSNAEGGAKSIENLHSSYVEFENEIHQKLMYALACLLFLFVGAPMGAIIRKGGFGMPVLVAFVFFMAFFVLNLVGERLAKELVTPCWLGSWLPMLVLLPISCLVTYKAINDAPLINSNKWRVFSSRWLKFLKKKKTQSTTK